MKLLNKKHEHIDAITACLQPERVTPTKAPKTHLCLTEYNTIIPNHANKTDKDNIIVPRYPDNAPSTTSKHFVTISEQNLTKK